ncbi:hypothetical protein Tco_0615555, partial [Tanacetum coccineum]
HDYDFCIDDDDDVKEINPYLGKKKKLILESKDYQQTLLFMDKLKVIAGQEQVSSKDLGILFYVYNMIMGVYCGLYKIIDSVESSSVWDIDVSLTINESRTKIGKECQANQNLFPEMKTTNKSKQGSQDGEFWSDVDFDFVYRDNNKRIKKQEDNFAQIDAIFKDCDSKDIGKGIEIQHASTTDESSKMMCKILDIITQGKE